MNADPELCYLDAAEARNRFREGSLSPVELVSSLVARIEAVEPKVNAFTHTFFDRALDEAREAEKRYADRGASARPLEGLPLVIKDFHDVKGEVTTYGSRLHEHHRPRKSLAYRVASGKAPTVLRMRKRSSICAMGVPVMPWEEWIAEAPRAASITASAAAHALASMMRSTRNSSSCWAAFRAWPLRSAPAISFVTVLRLRSKLVAMRSRW